MAVCDPTISNIVPKSDKHEHLATPSISGTIDNAHERTPADSDSDGSDPNISLAVEDALVEEEEHLMKEEEKNKQQFENQMLAVALMKSVVEGHASASGTTPPLTGESTGADGDCGSGSGNGSGGTKKVSSSSSLSEEHSLTSISSFPMQSAGGVDIVPKATTDADSKSTTNDPILADCSDLPSLPPITTDNGESTKTSANGTSAVQKPTIKVDSTLAAKATPRRKSSRKSPSSAGDPSSPNSTDGIYMGTRKRRRQGDGSKQDGNGASTAATPAGASTPTTTNKTTRQYTRGNHITSIAKGTRRYRKRGEGASPRSRRNAASSSAANPSLPNGLPMTLPAHGLPPPPELMSGVPNPILPSPSVSFEAANNDPSLAQQNLLGGAFMNNVPINTTIKMEPMISQTTSMNHSKSNDLPSINESDMAMNVGNGETTGTRSRSNSVSFTLPGLPQRNRIFSIDIDPEALNMGEPSTSAVESSKESSIAIKTEPNSTSQSVSSLKDDNKSTSSKGSRSRGMSFELFSFGVAQEEPMLDDTLMNGNGTSGGTDTVGRQRGDSIIFDPSSFSDGGIHEENALLRSRNNSLEFQENDEIDLLNIPGFVEPQTTNNSISETSKPKAPPVPPAQAVTAAAAAAIATPVLPPPVKSNSHVVRHHTMPKTSKSHYTFSTTSNPNSEDTIHMPQGSQAAAAAASLSSQIVSSNTNGSISHTSCPMELLNKAGRIGIYLPEARKARIAKFHSKRKSRIWRKRIKYDCRKKLADSRPRIKGRFVKSVED